MSNWYSKPQNKWCCAMGRAMSRRHRKGAKNEERMCKKGLLVKTKNMGGITATLRK
jgi:hypothetical protein